MEHADKPQEDTLFTRAAKAAEEHATNAIVEAARNRIKEIIAISLKIKPLKSDVGLIKKLYFSKQSHFDTIAKGYADSPWWGKSIAVVLLMGLSAMAGLAIGVAFSAVFAAIALSLYLTAAFFLNNHHEASQSRFEKLVALTTRMEESIAEELKLLGELERALKQQLTLLSELGLKMASDNALFSEALEALSANNSRLSGQIDELARAREALLSQNAQLIASLSTTKTRLDDAQGQLSEKITELAALQEELSEVPQSLEQTHQELRDVVDFYRRRNAALSAFPAPAGRLIQEPAPEKKVGAKGSAERSTDDVISEHRATLDQLLALLDSVEAENEEIEEQAPQEKETPLDEQRLVLH